MHNLYTLLFVLLSICSYGQTITVNASYHGATMGTDSSFYIPTNSTFSFNATNHPGAASYTSTKIVLCEGSILHYDYFWGTSNTPTFYLGKKAKLILVQPNAICDIYMQDSAIVDNNNQNQYSSIRRKSSASIINTAIVPANLDSIYATINYTFNGWPGNISPCEPLTTNNFTTTNLQVYPNPVNTYLNFTAYNQIKKVDIINTMGKIVLSKNNPSSAINIQALAAGLYTVKVYEQAAVSYFNISINP
jgi:hypothetical protein